MVPGKLGLTPKWSSHTHFFDFFHFILHFHVPRVELENRLIIYSETDSCCYLSALKSNRLSDPLDSFCHLLMQTHISSVQTALLLFVHTLWSSCCPQLSPSCSRTPPQHTCKEQSIKDLQEKKQKPFYQHSKTVNTMLFTFLVWRRRWLGLWEARGCKDLHPSLWCNTQWHRHTSHLWKTCYPKK